jgi:CRISPR type III-associated protein (TIGR04423 family)
MKIAQIWEEEPNEFCLNMEVLEPKYLLFAGFETQGGKS